LRTPPSRCGLIGACFVEVRPGRERSHEVCIGRIRTGPCLRSSGQQEMKCVVNAQHPAIARGWGAHRHLSSLAAVTLVACGPAAARPPQLMPSTAAISERVAPLVITAIDVGQGDCTLIECPNGSEILVDCGSTARGDRERVAALLADRVDAELDTLVVTHPDQDHINYLAPSSRQSSVIGDHRVARALLSLDANAYRETAVGARLIDWLAERADEIRYLAATDASPEGEPSDLFDCGDVNVYVLAASEPSQLSEEAWGRNTPSIVLMLERTIGGERFGMMLTGDATRETEAAIMARYSREFLDVDVLKIGHHGALTSTIDPEDANWAWLSTTTPRHAFCTAGHHGSYRHPRCAITDALLALGTLERVACHELECGEPAPGSCANAGPWCASATPLALFNSMNNGDVTFTFDGGLRVEFSRGHAQCPE
jgi:beta-lactamase superfamily II metal-dependent hydrolase